MQWFKEVDGGNPDGTAKDRVGLTAGTTYLAKYWNDNFFNIFNFVIGKGYSLIDDDLEQFVKASKGNYNPAYTYNTSAILTQTVSDIVEGSDGLYYEVQADGVIGDDPVGSITGNWKIKNFEFVTRNKKTVPITFPLDADYTLTDDENSYGRIAISGSVISTTRNLIVNNEEGFLTIDNNESFGVNIKTLAGTGVIVLSGDSAIVYNDGTNVILVSTNGGSSLLAEFEVTGAAATSIDFSGLDILSHKSYRVELELINVDVSTISIGIAINGDTTASNYYSQLLTVNGVTVTAGNTNGYTIAQVQASLSSLVDISLRMVGGYATASSQYTRGRDTALYANLAGVNKIASVTNITQITFISSIASAIGIGSKVRIYRGDV